MTDQRLTRDHVDEIHRDIICQFYVHIFDYLHLCSLQIIVSCRCHLFISVSDDHRRCTVFFSVNMKIYIILKNIFFKIMKACKRMRGCKFTLAKEQSRLNVRTNSFSLRTLKVWEKSYTPWVHASCVNMLS